ncbi:sugar-binding domain-containing protein [Pedobacter arcticus]|uniref:sugar-binding domain-containing protein n=1 Tax=Pedobacter arcticus TaxID=752140 RepID=UPI00037CC998
MSHAEIYLNNQFVGEWTYGYSSFSFDITKFINWGGNNVLAVRLENFSESACWCPGAVLYRKVCLVSTNPIHIKHCGTFISTTIVNSKKKC